MVLQQLRKLQTSLMKIKSDKILLRDAFFCTIMTFITAGILYFAFVNLSILDPFEKAFKDFKFTDIYYSERMNDEERNNKIVLVNIKHANRFQIAQAIDKINTQRPSVIGLDILFEDRKSEFIDSILPGLYSLKKTYPETKEMIAKVDSIILTLIDFKDKTEDYINQKNKGIKLLVGRSVEV